MFMTFHRALELLLGLPAGFLQQRGDWSLQLHPAWPGEQVLGAAVWNLLLVGLMLLLAVHVYRRSKIPLPIRLLLGALRLASLALLLFLLNLPTLTLSSNTVEPSVLAIVVDDSSSMRVPDAGDAARPQSRLAAAQALLSGHDGEVLKTLGRTHQLRLYRFDRDAAPLASPQSIATLTADADATQVVPSLLTVARDLQGQRVAGIALLTDGRDSPTQSAAADLDRLKGMGMKVYPVAIGTTQAPRNIQVQSVSADDIAFSGDAVNVVATVRATGFEPNHRVHLVLKDKKTGAVLLQPDGQPAQTTVVLPGDQSVSAELQWQTSAVGDTELSVEAPVEPGEIDATDNARSVNVSVLQAKIAVLLVDGSPRWDYRFLKTALLRDKSVSVSCILSSADLDFDQEGNKPLPTSGSSGAPHFPDTLEQLMDYDVLVVGDVDPHFFTDDQLQLINDFVSRGGGFMMVAGERWSPQAYRGTPLEAVLPVTLAHVEATDADVPITHGFRPVVTPAGEALGIFRFFPDRAVNDRFLRTTLPNLFWYCRGVTAKPGVGEVLAEHPSDIGPDGHPAPLLVCGRLGGRTLFSGIDDSWRWRFFTGEPVFDSYWVRQLRYLARGRRLNQRQLALTADQASYELGAPVRLTLRVIDPGLVRQLPDQVPVQLRDAGGQPVRTASLVRTGEDGGEVYAASFTADRVGAFHVQVPSLAAGLDPLEAAFSVFLPRLELADARVDRQQLDRIASETAGVSTDLAHAAHQLLAIPSAEKLIPQTVGRPLLATPATLALFVLLLGGEWSIRKSVGMV
jgi:uncharacterized membrane protein